MKKIITIPILIYTWIPQLLFKGILFPLEGTCRFSPTCSQYAGEAISTHGPIKGAALSVRRVFRCHPWGGSGFDPVPPIRARQKAKKPL